MAFHPLATAILLLMSFMTIHAALPSEQYWNTMLPGTPMPRAITMALPVPAGKKELSAEQLALAGNDNYGNSGYNNQDGRVVAEPLKVAGNDGYGNSGYNSQEHSVVADPLTGLKASGNDIYTNSEYKNQEHSVVAEPLKQAGNDGYGNSFYDSEEHSVVAEPLKAAGNDGYGNSEYSINRGLKPLVNPPTALYFLEKDLFAGKEFSIEINRRENGASAFIPRRLADSIPFSSDKLSIILNKFSVKLGSKDAERMRRTINMCARPAEKDETKQCVTSLESMIDFTVAELGKNIQAVSTEADKDTKIQKFKVLNGVKLLASDEAVVCHKETYPYAVFLCHDLKATRSYLVPFIGADGTKAKATAVCHIDTSGWNPEHMALRILGVKAGTVPVCHFLPEYDVVWTRK